MRRSVRARGCQSKSEKSGCAVGERNVAKYKKGVSNGMIVRGSKGMWE